MKTLVPVLGLTLALFFSACSQKKIPVQKTFTTQACPHLQTFDALPSCKLRARLMSQQIKEYNLIFGKKGQGR